MMILVIFIHSFIFYLSFIYFPRVIEVVESKVVVGFVD